MTWSDFLSHLFSGGLRPERCWRCWPAARICTCPHLHFHHGIHVPHFEAHGGGEMELPWFNFGTIAAFLAWFGGTGYLLEHYYGVWFALALAVATVSGMGGARVVFWFLAKVLMSREAGARPGGLRHGRRAGQAEHSDPRRAAPES